MKETSLETYFSRHASPNQLLNTLDKLDSEASLKNFIKCGWSVLEPGREFIPGWHIDAICDHLEAVSSGQLTRLLINVPPGCMKSLTTEVFWPAWEWGPKGLPSCSYVSSSYSQDLTIRDNRKCRTLIQSDWYQAKWKDRFQIIGEQNSKIRFDNDKTGFKIATSVGGLGTGERGDRFIIDDPHNVQDGESDAIRNSTLLWFSETVPTRVRSPQKSAIIIIMQRVHDEDVSGYAIARELGYEHLMLPMEFEPDRKCITSIGFEDPRTEENELLWPKQMNRTVVERDKKVMGEYAVAGQFQQRPSPRGGGMFKRDWFKVIEKIPEGISLRTCRGWDLAASETQNAAYTAGVRISKGSDNNFYIQDVKRLRGSPSKVDTLLKNTAKDDGMSVRISIPQDPGQAGKAQKKYLSSLLVGYDVRFSTETGDKETRATGLSAQAEAGNVYIIRGAWNTDFLTEICSFPTATLKDQVDAAARAFNELVGKKKNSTPVSPTVIDLRG